MQADDVGDGAGFEAAPGFEALANGKAIAKALHALASTECSGAYEDAARRVVACGWDVHLDRLVGCALATRAPREVATVLLRAAAEACGPKDDFEQTLYALAGCTLESESETSWRAFADELCEMPPQQCVALELTHAVGGLFGEEPFVRANGLRDLVLAIVFEYGVARAGAFVREVERQLGADVKARA